jgi:hypothetical protein
MHGSLPERPSQDSRIGQPALNLMHWRTQAFNCFFSAKISALHWGRECFVDFPFP